MESTIKEEAELTNTEGDGEFYYMRALNYLATSTSENTHSDGDDCGCLHSEAKDDEHFTLGFRRGLTRDHDDTHSSGSSSGSSSSNSPRGSDGGSSHHAGALTSSVAPTSPRRRERKCSIGGRFYKTGNSEFGKIEPKRKMSDGHVHWADEFQKELTRCNPRKSYSRHPSHLSSQVKPILKLSHESGEDC